MARTPRLLYLSPVIPAFAGNGLAMRGARVLEVLASHYAVTLHVRTTYASPVAALPAELAARCQEVWIGAPTDAPPTSRGGRWPWSRNGRRKFEVVHAFRLASQPYVAAYLDGPGGQPP